MTRKFVTTVGDPPESGSDEFEGFTLRETPPYAAAADVPRSVRILIAKAAHLRNISAADLAAVYGLPEAWVTQFLAETTDDDLNADLTAHGVPVGRWTQ